MLLPRYPPRSRIGGTAMCRKVGMAMAAASFVLVPSASVWADGLSPEQLRQKAVPQVAFCKARAREFRSHDMCLNTFTYYYQRWVHL